jgi:hypothetical protein
MACPEHLFTYFLRLEALNLVMVNLWTEITTLIFLSAFGCLFARACIPEHVQSAKSTGGSIEAER